MKYFKSFLIFLLTLAIFAGCKKSGNGDTKTPPKNLIIKATVSTDSSGTVTFTATAENASSYFYQFGNGDNKSVSDGLATYQYLVTGTNSYTVSVTATNSSGLTVKSSVQITVTRKYIPPVLFWSDEFNTDGPPDPLKWGYDIGNGSNGWGNSELEYYTNRPENAVVQNGSLKITAIRENYSGSPFTSARLLSKDKFDFTYGKVEVRAKLPAAVGTWPAIWMLGSNFTTVPWPGCGEIDIMEARGSEPNKIFGTLHYPGRSGATGDGGTTLISNASTEFHIYSLQWNASTIEISVDSQAYHTVVNSGSLPFNHDFFFILNVAMGGNFAGNVDGAFAKDSLLVDYVRVYR
ncbi:MAG: family 16 glycosylhydrolase [Bacteroidota bacterium]|nr:family 16 glycosylhydrolase [Bacteroidota bacterium]